jgi:hypothetical protein
VLYSYRIEIDVIKLSHCMKLFLYNQRLFGLLLNPINSLFLRPFHPKRAYFAHPHCSVWTKRAIVIGIPLAYHEIRLVHRYIKTPVFQGFFVSAKRFELLTNGLKGRCSAVELRAQHNSGLHSNMGNIHRQRKNLFPVNIHQNGGSNG